MVAVAARPIEAVEMNALVPELERGLYFQGVLSLADPPRPEIKETLAQVARAGMSGRLRLVHFGGRDAYNLFVRRKAKIWNKKCTSTSD